MGVGRASDGPVYAAARKVLDAQPFNAAAYNVLGLTCEARGDFEGAVKAFSDGLDVHIGSQLGDKTLSHSFIHTLNDAPNMHAGRPSVDYMGASFCLQSN